VSVSQIDAYLKHKANKANGNGSAKSGNARLLINTPGADGVQTPKLDKGEN
jgi:hypothetical protein